MLEQAIAGKFVKKIPHPDDGRKKALVRVGLDEENFVWTPVESDTSEFWEPILANEKFSTYVSEKYRLPESEIL